MIRGAVIVVLLTFNTILWGIPITLLGLIKVIAPGKAARRWIRVAMGELADQWVGRANRIFDAMLTTEWDVSGVEGLVRDGHYLILSNHVSWADIFVVFRAFHRRVAFLRFFIKQELIWFPIVGQACWAMDYPFMRRYSADYLAHHPEKRGTDLETTRRSIRRYRHIPLAILNFIEGTRFTRDKHADQDSPYRNLLRPRLGGVAFVLASLGEQLDGVIDVTIVYPEKDITLWQFLTNRIDRIVIRARTIDTPAEFLTAAITEPGPERERFKTWMEQLWREKDDLISSERTVVHSYHGRN